MQKRAALLKQSGANLGFFAIKNQNLQKFPSEGSGL
jgi:hypothetical protein